MSYLFFCSGDYNYLRTFVHLILRLKSAILSTKCKILWITHRFTTFCVMLHGVIHLKILTTNGTFYNHSIPVDQACPSYPYPFESIWHCLRGCRRAKTIWSNLPTSKEQWFTKFDNESWFTKLLSNHNTFNGACLSTLGAFILWNIWLNRNKFLFLNSVINPNFS